MRSARLVCSGEPADDRPMLMMPPVPGPGTLSAGSCWTIRCLSDRMWYDRHHYVFFSLFLKINFQFRFAAQDPSPIWRPQTASSRKFWTVPEPFARPALVDLKTAICRQCLPDRLSIRLADQADCLAGIVCRETLKTNAPNFKRETSKANNGNEHGLRALFLSKI